MDGVRVYDMVIIGGGPAGCTAALYAARAGLAVVVLERGATGGQMALSSQIDNYPGFEAGIGGFELARKMREGAERFGAEIRSAEVRKVSLREQIKVVETAEGQVCGKTVVVAAGAVHRELGLPGEAELTGRGVAYCAACDGRFFQGRTVAVVGGGSSAAADALYLSRIAKRVILIHRRDTLRAAWIDHELLKKAGNVEFRWDSVVTELLAEDVFTGVRLRNVKTGSEFKLPCDGLFVSIGRKPESGLVRGQLELDAGGYIIAGEDTRTGLPGVYAAGDVRTKALRQIVTAAADGAAAVHSAEEYLASET